MKPLPATLTIASLACLLCCLGPAIPLLVGGMAAGAAVHELILCYRDPISIGIASVAAIAAATLLIRKSRARKRLGPGTQDVTAQKQHTPPIACTLRSPEMPARLAELRQLTADALIAAVEQDLTLHLVYKREEETRVRHMVQMEAECCAFLTFEVRLTPTTIEVRITAPEEARAAIIPIYAHLSPGSASTA